MIFDRPDLQKDTSNHANRGGIPDLPRTGAGRREGLAGGPAGADAEAVGGRAQCLQGSSSARPTTPGCDPGRNLGAMTRRILSDASRNAHFLRVSENELRVMPCSTPRISSPRTVPESRTSREPPAVKVMESPSTVPLRGPPL